MARILMAEDDKAVQSFVSRALAHRGHAVTAVDDGLEALEALEVAEFDILITDIVMPGLDGIALALKVARDRPNLPILMTMPIWLPLIFSISGRESCVRSLP